VFHDPIPGDMLRKPYTQPQVGKRDLNKGYDCVMLMQSALHFQVEVIVNGIPSLCTADCTFMWSAEKTPVIHSFTPKSGAHVSNISKNFLFEIFKLICWS